MTYTIRTEVQKTIATIHMKIASGFLFLKSQKRKIRSKNGATEIKKIPIIVPIILIMLSIIYLLSIFRYCYRADYHQSNRIETPE
jgi:hypothetical protein